MGDAFEPAPNRQSQPLGLAPLLVLALVCGCGRTEHNDAAMAAGAPQAGAPQAGAAGDDPSPSSGVGPIDASGQPDALVVCPARSEPLTIQLPCSVGQNLAGPVDQPGQHVVECKLRGTLGADAVFFMLPLAEVPNLLDQPVRLPLEPALVAPTEPDAPSGDLHLVGTLAGLITFTQVDLDGRAFVATLEQGQLEWGGDPDGDFNCPTLDGPLWAVAGNFL